VGDWPSRDADIFFTNDVYAIPYGDRILASEYGKKLMSTTEFIIYVQEKIRGNKYLYLNLPNYNKNSTGTKEVPIQDSEKAPIQKRESESLLTFIDSKQSLPGSANIEIRKAKLTCENCRKRNKCDILREVEKLEVTIPRKATTQTDLLGSFTRNTSPSRLIVRLKDWMLVNGDKYHELQDKQERCLNEMAYLYEKKKFRVFDAD